jgi:hypothetical protein
MKAHNDLEAPAALTTFYNCTNPLNKPYGYGQQVVQVNTPSPITFPVVSKPLIL